MPTPIGQALKEAIENRDKMLKDTEHGYQEEFILPEEDAKGFDCKLPRCVEFAKELRGNKPLPPITDEERLNMTPEQENQENNYQDFI